MLNGLSIDQITSALSGPVIVALVLFGFVFVIYFIIWPIVLLIQCVFDNRIGIIYKLTTFFFSFIIPTYPIPSFVYGAFIRKQIMSMMALGMYVLMFIGVIFLLFFMGGIAIVSGILLGEGEISQKIETYIEQQAGKDENIEDSYKGYNTYDPDDVQIFEDGKGAVNRDDIQVPPREPEPMPEQPDPIQNTPQTGLSEDECLQQFFGGERSEKNISICNCAITSVKPGDSKEQAAAKATACILSGG